MKKFQQLKAGGCSGDALARRKPASSEKLYMLRQLPFAPTVIERNMMDAIAMQNLEFLMTRYRKLASHAHVVQLDMQTNILQARLFEALPVPMLNSSSLMQS